MKTHDVTAPPEGLRSLSYVDAAPLLVVGDSATARGRAAAAAAASGIAISAKLDVGDALARLEDGPVPGCVMVEIETAPDDASVGTFERLLARLDADAAAGRFASVVSTGPGLIDLVAALAPHERVQQLADATDGDRIIALGLATRPASGSVRETSVAGQAAQLRALTEEVGRISGTLARLAASGQPRPVDAPRARVQTGAVTDVDRDVAAQIGAIIRTRQLRARYFDPALFADPAWDMLLDLMAAHIDAKRVAVSSLCIAAAVPATTALRWIRILTDHGLFVRRADPMDGRRVFIELSEQASDGMRGYLDAVRAA